MSVYRTIGPLVFTAGAEVRTLDFSRLQGYGILHTKMWLIDRKHFYVGSANLDWRSFTQVRHSDCMSQYVVIIEPPHEKTNNLHMRNQRCRSAAVVDLEGVQGVHSKPPLEPNYFIFMGNFEKFCVKLGKQIPPFLHLNPLFRNSGSALELCSNCTADQCLLSLHGLYNPSSS